MMGPDSRSNAMVIVRHPQDEHLAGLDSLDFDPPFASDLPAASPPSIPEPTSTILSEPLTRITGELGPVSYFGSDVGQRDYGASW
ncbi:hypothetical protein Asppvi_009976 [Aspergillus pseudoviridinutans]|uniref:Uncharacterized protein n=1 Tax=Aspergillus pseudoviridinutans TaxID=1517512 RepID=A0A9P3BNP7_9EURO|nr:uncharacterized protein Asppvi_009976 [Aspergillus pseudoviridinutans]GIJ91011.1 hypothetical protein Asppvi_009976 [Aspergillus pseudoviridinutans]